MTVPPQWLAPRWPAPPNVHAATTTRLGGVSAAPYGSLNLGDHVGDDPSAVVENRRRVRTALALPAEPGWPRQVHGVRAVAATAAAECEADAVYAESPGRVCAILTADCLPVLLCDDAGRRIAAAHAGWRGLADGVLERTVAALAVPGERLLAWLGPAIGPGAFEVGPEVRARFLDRDAGAADAFALSGSGRWLADLYALARRRLTEAGVVRVYGGGFCTYSDSERFYSYRRDGVTGRMATLIWRTA